MRVYSEPDFDTRQMIEDWQSSSSLDAHGNHAIKVLPPQADYSSSPVEADYHTNLKWYSERLVTHKNVTIQSNRLYGVH